MNERSGRYISLIQYIILLLTKIYCLHEIPSLFIIVPCLSVYSDDPLSLRLRVKEEVALV